MTATWSTTGLWMDKKFWSAMQYPSHSLPTTDAAPTPLKSTPRALPSRKVTAETIEDAYVQFILYCNPAVPLETDTAALGEAFGIPPKSGGKLFSTYTLFELIRQFQDKEIKTWAELALRLGVDPPDQGKGQSTQKIQQYAVRLKRWMHSMHLDAFFDYMLENSHPYWTEIPQDPNPVIEDGRDGVAAEDDMALRALLPHIRPRRGRKRPDGDDSSLSPSHRPRMEGGGGEYGAGALGGSGGSIQQLDLWPAHTEEGSALLPPNDHYARMSMSLGNLEASWARDCFVPTPLTAHPYSAITPSTGQILWSEQPEEPKSAVTPSRSKSNRRHGAKVVSSAWRSGGPGGSGKTRGRPPLSRQISNTTNDPSSPFSAFLAQSTAVRRHSLNVATNMTTAMATHSSSVPHATTTPVVQANINSDQHQETPFGISQHSQPRARDLRSSRSRLSLHVPERTSEQGRIATPSGPHSGPPVVMINGSTVPGHQNTNFNFPPADLSPPTMDAFRPVNNPYVPFQQQHPYQVPAPGPAQTQYASSPVGFQHSQQQNPRHKQPRGVRFIDPSDRTNMDEIETLFISDMITADWFDSAGNPIPPCSVEEAAGVAQQVIEDVMHGATTKETFLINIAVLAGSSIMKGGRSLRVQRTIAGDDFNTYQCQWELQLGDVKGSYSMRVALAHGKWKYKAKDPRAMASPEEGEEDDAEGEADDDAAQVKGASGEAERWQKKYRDLLGVVQQQRCELNDFRRGIYRMCQPNPGEHPDGGISEQ